MIFNAVLPAQSAGGGTSVTMAGVYQLQPNETDTLDTITVTSPTAVTGTNTNYFTLNVRQLRAGTALHTLATQAFTVGTNLAVEVPFPLTVNLQPQFEANDVIDVQLVQSGTGLAVPVGVQVAVVVG
jgi:hypothetical protein